MRRQTALVTALLYGCATLTLSGIAVLRRAGSEDPPFTREQLAVNLSLGVLLLAALFVFGVTGSWRLEILASLWAAHLGLTLATIWALEAAGLRGAFVWPLAVYEVLGLATLALLGRPARPTDTG